MTQLTLPLKLDDHAVFSSFFAGRNAAVVDHLQRAAGDGTGSGAWLWGPEAVGKSHLLQATCAAAGDRSAYVPMTVVADAGPEAVDGLASREIVCIDDVHHAAGDAGWERALFLLYNDLAAGGGRLVVAADMPPRQAGFTLPDLESRMSQLPIYNVEPLSDTERAQALRLRATHRGLELPEETARYLLGRSRRDMASLYGLLDRLDLEALRAQRRLTVPFVRDVLAADTKSTSG